MLERETQEKSRARLSATEREKVRAVMRFRSPVIYEIIRREGEEELHRPTISLLVAGIAAGIAMGFSALSEALLVARLPEQAAWTPLVGHFGYCVGFLIVIMARLQLFTENTITAVMPICAYPTGPNFLAVARLWGIVLVGNLAGTLVFAAFIRYCDALTPEDYAAFTAICERLLDTTFSGTLVAGVVSGFLIACLVWVTPTAEGAEFWMILIITYIIALGQFAHVVVGSGEAWFLVLDGKMGLGAALGGYVVPALIGNIIGGTGLFTLLAYTQVSTEIDETSEAADAEDEERRADEAGTTDTA